MLARTVESSEECIILRGVVRDPHSLDYLRDAVGLVMALVDSGGIAVFDAHAFQWWSGEEWRLKVFEQPFVAPHQHVSLMASEEQEPERRWYHTRGMIKFGRPDLSVHNVEPELEAGVEALCNRLIESQVLGAVVAEGEAVRMRSLPPGWRCRHRGSLDDPDFNNRHIEIGPER